MAVLGLNVRFGPKPDIPFSPRYGSQLECEIRRDYPMRRPLLTYQ